MMTAGNRHPRKRRSAQVPTSIDEDPPGSGYPPTGDKLTTPNEVLTRYRARVRADLRRGHYDLATEAAFLDRVAAAFGRAGPFGSV